MFAGRRILVAVTGGIAAYKVCDVVSSLAKQEAEVRVVMSGAAERFVSALTFASLARHRAYTDADFWSAEHGSPLHIELGRWAEAVLVAPLTANSLAKIAWGLADDLMTNVLLATAAPVLLAPAMNTQMWAQPTVERNWTQVLALDQFHSSGPESGRLACDSVGSGRMSEPDALVEHLASLLISGGRRDLRGRTVLISAGGTREHLDPVRFLGNPASGRMGFALAAACAHRGARVRLVAGPNTLCVPPGIEYLPVEDANGMREAMLDGFAGADVAIMAAAVADVRPGMRAAGKLPKADLPTHLPLVPVPDILAELAACRRPGQILVGFAAQTGDDFLVPARRKLVEKGVDLLVANRIDRSGSGFGCDSNQAILLGKQGQAVELPRLHKLELAHRILDSLETLL